MLTRWCNPRASGTSKWRSSSGVSTGAVFGAGDGADPIVRHDPGV